MHGNRIETDPDQGRGPAVAHGEEFPFADSRGQVDAVVEVAVPIGDVALPPCEIAASLFPIFLPLQHIEPVDRVERQIGRMTAGRRLQTLRRPKTSDRNEGGQFAQAVEVVPFGLAGGVGEAAFDGVDHRRVLSGDRRQLAHPPGR